MTRSDELCRKQYSLRGKKSFPVPVPPLGSLGHPVYVCSRDYVGGSNVGPKDQMCQCQVRGRAVVKFINYVCISNGHVSVLHLEILFFLNLTYETTQENLTEPRSVP